MDELDKEVLRVIKAVGFPISARALHEIFRGRWSSTQVTQVVWRHMNTKVQLDVEMKISWKEAR